MEIKLVLENCESISFAYPRDVSYFETSHIKTRYVSCASRIKKELFVDGFTMVIRPNGGIYASLDDKETTAIQRLAKFKDVTQIVLEDDDGNEEVIFVSWEGVKDPSYMHDGQDLITTGEGNTIYFSEAGEYQSLLKTQPLMADAYSWSTSKE